MLCDDKVQDKLNRYFVPAYVPAEELYPYVRARTGEDPTLRYLIATYVIHPMTGEIIDVLPRSGDSPAVSAEAVAARLDEIIAQLGLKPGEPFPAYTHVAQRKDGLHLQVVTRHDTVPPRPFMIDWIDLSPEETDSLLPPKGSLADYKVPRAVTRSLLLHFRPSPEVRDRADTRSKDYQGSFLLWDLDSDAIHRLGEAWLDARPTADAQTGLVTVTLEGGFTITPSADRAPVGQGPWKSGVTASSKVYGYLRYDPANRTIKEIRFTTLDGMCLDARGNQYAFHDVAHMTSTRWP